MQIGIIGGGSVGGTLGTGWARKGHKIRFGVRHPDSIEMRELLRQIGTAASAGSVAEAATFGEAVVLATPWPATQEALRSAGDLTGKVLLDCTNPLKPDPAGLELGTTGSGGEMVAEWAAGARVVKIFNTTGFGNMANPRIRWGRPRCFTAGTMTARRWWPRSLRPISDSSRWNAGPLRNARLLEPLAMLWIWMAVFGGMGRDFALKLMRR